MIIERTHWTFETVDALGHEGRERLRRQWATRQIYNEAQRYDQQWTTQQDELADGMQHVR